jgi:hypothetical protein
MATYLVVLNDKLAEVDGKNIQEAIGKLALGAGDVATVYRIAGPARTVEIKTETVTKLAIT